MKEYIFPTILLCVAFFMAACAAVYTVIGFQALWGASITITAAAVAIEAGKIMGVSVLYQLSNKLAIWWKVFIFTLVIIAMVVTSMGIYGKFSSAYQKDSLAITQNDARQELLDDRKVALEERLAGMDAQIIEVPETYVTKRMELIATFKPERDVILSELQELEDKKLELTLDKIDRESEFGGIVLLANSFDWLDKDKAMLYFIFLVILIFDPMAIALTYAANVAYARASDSKNNILSTSTNREVNSSKEDIKTLTTVVESLVGEVSDIKNRKPVNPRADLMDSMRNL